MSQKLNSSGHVAFVSHCDIISSVYFVSGSLGYLEGSVGVDFVNQGGCH
jgi:hypothetical protein